MRQRILITILLLALALAACQGEKSQPGTSATQAPVAAATLQQAVPTATSQTTQATLEGTQAPASCTVVSVLPTPGPTEQSAFPPVSADDWTQGPESAYLTVIEYGDFM